MGEGHTKMRGSRKRCRSQALQRKGGGEAETPAHPQKLRENSPCSQPSQVRKPGALAQPRFTLRTLRIRLSQLCFRQPIDQRLDRGQTRQQCGSSARKVTVPLSVRPRVLGERPPGPGMSPTLAVSQHQDLKRTGAPVSASGQGTFIQDPCLRGTLNSATLYGKVGLAWG